MAMPTDVIMPQMGESIFEGTISKWLKHVGDTVEKDEPLFEISTDKVDAEIPSPSAGVLKEIRAEEGSTVEVNTVVAVIGEEAGAAAPKRAAAESAAAQPPASTAAPEPPTEPGTPAPPGAAESEESEPAAPVGPSKTARTSPLVRRLAKDHNLDLEQITGTGLEGRITKEDVLHHLNQKEMQAPGPEAPAPPAPAEPAAAPKPRVAPKQPAAPAPTAATPETAAEPASPSPVEVAPLSRIRAIIAQRMAASWQSIPHAHTIFKVDMTSIVRLRERDKQEFEQRNGIKLTYMPFIATAAVEALRKFPIVNAAIENGGIRYRQNVNLGIAVALEWGLIVPVVRQAEERSFLGLARALADLAERARSKRLKPEEVAGSTFTLTNAGIFGEEFGMPIINQPDSAILGIGGLCKEPVVMSDAQGEDTIAIRSIQRFSLGFDHRLIDGADAGKFMSEFKKALENWNREIA
jgi:pyruvate dehydrogenase E2 component (dihydrolipoamide acetyltransferase)